MFTLQKASAVSTILAGLLLSVGCEAPELDVDNEQVVSSPADSQTKSAGQPSKKVEVLASDGSSGDAESLNVVMKAWESGAKDEAVSKLLQIDWESPAAIGDIPVMGYSEKEFSKLSSSERGEQQAVAMKLASDSKAILRHAFSLAEQAEGAGNNGKAKQYYEAVRGLGNALAGPKKITALQMMGKALVEMADEKLAAQK